MKSISEKPTLFSVIGLIIIIIGLPYGLYCCTLDGGSSLGGGIILFFVFCTGLILLVDRVLVLGIKPLPLSIGELMVIIVGLGVYFYDTREIEIDISSNKTPFFIVAFTQVSKPDSSIKSVFPFDKYIRVDDKKYVELDQNWEQTYQINITPRKSWEYIKGIPFTLPNLGLKGQVYYGSKLELTKSQIDSVIKAER